MKFNNSIDILKEKLGAVVLPLIVDFVTEMTKPGGIVETVGKFFTDMSNPKTDAGKMFRDIKNAVKSAFGYVKDFFALFGNGDAMKGFGQVAGFLIKMLPALIAFKGIMLLASGGKAIAGLVSAIAALRGVPTTGIPTGDNSTVVGADGKPTKTPKTPKTNFQKVKTKVKKTAKLGFLAAILGGGDLVDTAVTLGGLAALKTPVGRTAELVLTLSGDTQQKGPRVIGKPTKYQQTHDFTGNTAPKNVNPLTTYNITVNSTNADPKAVVDAVSKYVKTNGGVPSAWGLSAQYHGGGH
jgi:hypothetical protein